MNSYVTALFTITAVFCISSAGSEPAAKHGGKHLAVPETQLLLRLPESNTELGTSFDEASRVMHFEANNGQVDEDVKFLVRGSDYQLFLTGTEAIMVLQPVPDQPPSSPTEELDDYRIFETEKEATRTAAAARRLDPQSQVLRMRLAGANANSSIQGDEPLPGKANYFIGNDPSRWHTNISTFAKVRYREVYPGIDLVYYGSEGRLEYDFVLAPGAEPGLITLNFDGADRIELDARGDLIAWVAGHGVRWRKPIVYQEINRPASRDRRVISDKRIVSDPPARCFMPNWFRVGCLQIVPIRS